MAKGSALSAKVKIKGALAEFMGSDTASRADVVKELWKYIKKHDLQNPKNMREIIPDDTLASILGSKKLTMFEMTKKWNKFVG